MDKSTFYATLRKRKNPLFGDRISDRQIAGMEGIIKAFTDEVGEPDPDLRAKFLAYTLATAYHETARRMSPVRETLANSDEQAINRLERWARQNGRTTNIYWRPEPPYGHAYFGRGQVQLTWKSNYEASSEDAGVDLVADPNKMLDPEISARVMIRGLLDGRWNAHGVGLMTYLRREDLQGARRTVNITDRWIEIAGHYAHFLDAIMTAGGAPARSEPEPTRRPGFLRSLFDAIRGLRKGSSDG